MIKFEELNNYINKPVWDDAEKRWRILSGYQRILLKFSIAFTDTNHWDFRDVDKLEIYEYEVK